ncbi:hypothetical protein KN815_09395 [Streptomyces sp. 4503]|uniref:Transposase n=1 Tax=Streptomyces niphimycinicus TaxID=2842201 RepID=A0ABS6CBK3_9ACTN|nr:hypothetical protein [Streptomyces niphimycinicus]MBU3864281.1 hypothetical protein [Streptomyces niphimycinicus]
MSAHRRAADDAGEGAAVPRIDLQRVRWHALCREVEAWDDLEAMAQTARHQFFAVAVKQIGIENRLCHGVQANPSVFGVEKPEETSEIPPLRRHCRDGRKRTTNRVCVESPEEKLARGLAPGGITE